MSSSPPSNASSQGSGSQGSPTRRSTRSQSQSQSASQSASQSQSPSSSPARSQQRGGGGGRGRRGSGRSRRGLVVDSSSDADADADDSNNDNTNDRSGASPPPGRHSSSLRPTSELSSPLAYPSSSSSPPSSPWRGPRGGRRGATATAATATVRGTAATAGAGPSTGNLFSSTSDREDPSSHHPEFLRETIEQRRGGGGGIRRSTSLEPTSSQNDGSVTATPTQTPQEPVLTRSVIWGTTIVVSDIWDSYKDFLLNFSEKEFDEPFYLKQLHQMAITETYVFNLNTSHLKLYERAHPLYKLLVKYPTEMIAILNVVLEDLFREKFLHDEQQVPQLQARPFNLESSVNMRDLNPGDIDKLVSIKGIVIRVSGVIPDLKIGFFKCLMCDQTETVKINHARVDEPVRCPRCQQERSMTLIHNRCKFTDKQLIRLQETPDSVPAGQTPHTITLVAVDDLVDVPRPGDRVEVTGIYRAMPVRVVGHQRTVRSIYRTFIEVVHYKLSDSKRLKSSRTDLDPNEFSVPVDAAERYNLERAEMEERIKALAKDPNIYEILTRSIAPSIWEMDHVKKGVLCQLFSGRNKIFNEGASRFRGEMNILLCGDPGTSKSQMLQYIHKIAPRGIYTSGKGSSAVGLTAYVSRDPETRQFVLESGALVLSDGGICCIDEFDKMSDSTRAVLHEVMEQQTVSVAKAGIICTLNARTSILASANPIDSRWNIHRPILENIDLPPTLVSRFDLIYLILDKPNETGDRRLAQHIVQMYQETTPAPAGQILDIEMLSAYISYAKEAIQPVLTDEAANLLIDGYVAMRRGGAGKKTVTATPRQLESLIRISESLAKIRLSNTVEKPDVEEAIRLMKEALQTSAIDPSTGLIDMDLITTGLSSVSRKQVVTVSKELKTMLDNMSATSIRFSRLAAQYREEHEAAPSDAILFDALTELQTENYVWIKGGSGPKSNPTIQKTGVALA